MTAIKNRLSVKQRIVDAAIHQFAQKGAIGASFASIANDIGMSKQALMHHFPTKSILKSAAIAETIDKSRVVMPKIVALLLSKDPTTELRILEDLLDNDLENTDWAVFLLKEALSDGNSLLSKEMMDWCQFIIQEMNKAVKAGILKPDLDTEAALANVSLMTLGVLATLDNPTTANFGHQNTLKSWQLRKLKELARMIRSGCLNSLTMEPVLTQQP